jgi:adenylate kinase family enzyme
MNRKNMKKIIVIGCPGSGKSTLARALHNKICIPLYHLDMMYWNRDKTKVEKSVFLERLSSVLENDEWIIDGNYGSTMDVRMAACDTVIFLDYPSDICVEGVRERRGKPRSDMPWIETEEDEEFIEFVKTYNEQQKPKVLELLKKYSDKNIIILESREQANAFLLDKS